LKRKTLFKSLKNIFSWKKRYIAICKTPM
jgi:hypothetical protein